MFAGYWFPDGNGDDYLRIPKKYEKTIIKV